MSLLCRLVGVSRAGYYAWGRRSPSQRAQADGTLTEAMRAIHARSRQSYGSPRIHAALCTDATRVRRTRVARLLRAAGLRGCGARRKVRTTQSDPAATPAPNLVQRRVDVGALNRVWGTDSTCLATAGSTSWRPCSTPARDAWWAGHWPASSARSLRWRRWTWRSGNDGRPAARWSITAIAAVSTPPAPITPCARPRALPVPCSMRRTGHCLDNAMAESFFATLKRELMPATGWPTRGAARAAVCDWIAGSDNRQRRHSSLGYRTPRDFEAAKEHLRAA